jgi:hypothetical protein
MNERKALMQALVHQISVESRAMIKPTFRFPSLTTVGDGEVRALARSAPSDQRGSKRKQPIGSGGNWWSRRPFRLRLSPRSSRHRRPEWIRDYGSGPDTVTPPWVSTQKTTMPRR